MSISHVPGQPWTPEAIDEVRAAWMDGESLASLAASCGISHQTMNRVLHKQTSAAMKEARRVALAARKEKEFADLRTRVLTWIEDGGHEVVDRKLLVNELGLNKQESLLLSKIDFGKYVVNSARGSNPEQFPNDTVIAALREVASRAAPRHLSQMRYNVLRLPSHPTHQTALRRFGTWNKALAAAGLPLASPGRAYVRHTDEEVLAGVREFLNISPRINTTAYDAWARQNKDAFSLAQVRNRIGDWPTIVRRALELPEKEYQ